MSSQNSVPPSTVDAFYEQVRALAPANDAGGDRQWRAISPHVRVAALVTPTLPPAAHTNTYVVGPHDGSGSIFVVDPGPTDPAEQRILIDLLRDEAAAGRELAAIVLTHHHGDHIGAALALQREFGSPIAAHVRTAERLDGYLPVQRILEDDEEIVVGDTRARVHYTPGHADGHICIWADNQDVIVGDMVAGFGTILIDPDEGDMAHYLDSLAALRRRDARRLLPAHGPVLADGPQALDRYIAHRTMREAKVLAAVRTLGSGIESALVAVSYDDTPPMLWPLAALSQRSHLLKLLREGRVARDGERWRAIEP